MVIVTRVQWIVLVLAVACSSSGTAPTSRSEGSPSEREPWTVARAIAAIPADASVVMTVDTRRLRESGVLGPQWPALIDFVKRKDKRPYRELCHDRDATMLAVMFADLTWTIWIFGVPVRELETCRRASPDTTSLALDDRTLLLRIGPGTRDATAMRALAQPATAPLRAPELDWIVQSGTPFGVFVQAAPSRLAALLEAEPVGSAMIAEVGERLTLRGRARFADAATARDLASRITAFLRQLDRSLVTSGKAGATGTTTELEVTWEREPLVTLAAKIAPLLP